MSRLPREPFPLPKPVGLRRAAHFVTLLAAVVLAACGGGGSPTVGGQCQRGLASGFGAEVADNIISQVPAQEGQGGGEGDGGSVGGGQGIGIGGSDGQYTNVDVTIELTNGTTFGPWKVDETKGMVTYVHCGAVLPAKITFEGKSADARYYDEGLQRDVSFVGQSRIGLMTSYEKNVGVTALSHALYERSQTIGRDQGRDDGWKDLAIVEQAHRELLKTVNDQLPGLYRLEDLRRLPVILNKDNDQPNSGTLTANQNGTYGALVAGLNLAAATALPDSEQPALDMAETLIADLVDGELDSIGPGGQSTNSLGKTPYQFDSLWSAWTTGTGETAVRNGRDNLATDVLPIGVVRSRAAQGQGGPVTETEYVLASNGKLIANLNPSVNGGQPTQPGQDRQYSQLYRFGVEPVVALRRDGQGLLVFPTSWDGSLSFEVAPPTPAVRMLELIDAGFPVIRMSDGRLYRLEGRALSPEAAPAGMLNYSCRAEFDGALANGGDGRLGASNGRVCYGSNIFNQAVVWRPGSGAAGLPLEGGPVKQVSGNDQINLALLSDGSLLQLDHDHAVIFRDAAGNPVETLRGGETRELVAPGSTPLRLNAPKICWTRTPYVIDCDGTAYAVEYREYLDSQGNFAGAGPVTGLRRLAIPAPVWRTRSNQKVTAGDVLLGSDSVFIGTDDRIYDEDGQPISLPLDGTPVEQPNQPPPAPTVATVAGDDTISRAEASSPLIVNGLAQAASTVTATLSGQQQQATANGSGQWSVTFAPAQLPQTDGEVVLSIVAANGNGNSVPTTRVLTISLALPGLPTIAAVTGDNRITRSEAEAGVSIEGTATPGTTLRVNWSSQSKSTTVDPNGRWSVTFAGSEVPAPGESQVTATASNLNGSGESASVAVTVLPPLPVVTSILVSGDNVVSAEEAQSSVTVAGAATAGAAVAVRWNSVQKSTNAASNGSWSVSYGSDELPQPGRSTVSAAASNASGESQALEQIVEIRVPVVPPPDTPSIAAVTGDNIITAQEARGNITVSGSGSPDVSLEVNWGQIEKSTSSNSDGSWSVSFTPNEIPTAGPTTVTAQAFNAIGSSDIASITVRVEAAPPPLAQPAINTIAGNDVVDDGEQAQSVRISGTATPGSSISVSWSGVGAKSTTADSGGGWFVDYSRGGFPSPGERLVTVTSSQPGSSSTRATRSALVLDPTGAPIIDPVTGDDRITPAEVFTSSGVRLTVTGTGRPGQSLAVFLSNGSSLIREDIAIGTNGRWTVTLTERGSVFDQDGPAEMNAVNLPAGRPNIFDVRTVTLEGGFTPNLF